MRDLYDLLQPERLTSVVDVGSNPIDGSPPYTRMLDEGLCTVTGFDPQMSAKPRPGVTYLPHVVGFGDTVDLHVCSAPGMTSTLRPDPKALALFPGLAEWATVVETRTVATQRLDDVAPPFDLLCMDIQGGEVDVVIGAEQRLVDAAAVITEVSFVPLYDAQPTFGEIDDVLRSRGFIPHCFAAAKVWPMATRTQVPRLDPHQILEADMVYIRDPKEEMTDEQWKQLALIAHHVCGSLDLAMLCIEKLAERGAVRAEAPALYRQILEKL